MKKSKHNNSVVTYINEIVANGKICKALKFIHEYNLEYPKDIKGKIVEGKLLRLANRLEESENILSVLNGVLKEQSEFYNKLNLELLFLNLNLKKYHEAYNYFLKLQDSDFFDEIKFVDMTLIRHFLLVKTNQQEKLMPREFYGYYSKQIIDYKEEDFIEHYKNYFQTNEETIKTNLKYFNNNIDLDKLYLQIKEMLLYAKKYFAYSCFNTYIIKYNDVGYDNEGPINYLKVETLDDEPYEKIVKIAPYRAHIEKCFVNDFFELEEQIIINKRKLKK